MTRIQAVQILKAAENTRRDIVLRRQRAYFKPFFRAKKPWAAVAAKCAAAFALDIDRLLKLYRSACINAVTDAALFNDANVQKANRYKTHEYLDERYNRVVVPDVRDVLSELTGSFEASIAESYHKYISAGLVNDAGELVYNDLGMSFEFNQFDRLTRDYLRDKEINWSKQVDSETERVIKRELVKGYEDGLGSYEIAENIRQAAKFSFARSEAIARTEVMAACNYAEYTSMMENPDVIGAEWSAAGDERTRPTHRKASGQKRRKGELFNVGGYKMMYPGDISLGASAGEIIECRCTLLQVFKGGLLDSDTVYDEPDADTNSWLKRQDTDFREEYWGGKTKRALGDAGLLRLEERDRPLHEILERLYPVRTPVSEVRKVSALPEQVVKAALNRANTVWLHGALTNTEANVTLSAKTGAKAFKNVIGEHGRISSESESAAEWLEYLDSAKSRSVVTLHNHNNISSFSIADLKLFLGKESVKTMIVVDKDGCLFLLEKKPGVVYNADEIVSDILGELRKRYIKLQSLGLWKIMGTTERAMRKQKMSNYALSQVMKRREVAYGQFRKSNP